MFRGFQKIYSSPWTWAAFFTALLFLVAWSAPDASESSVKNGVASLSGWDFQKDGTVVLNGEWDFYWEELVSPFEGPSPAQKKSSIDSRYPWNHANNTIEGELPRPALGYATYVLRLQGLPTNTELMLRLTNSVMAYELYWVAKGEPISDEPTMANGTVHPTDPIPHSVNQVVSVQTGEYGEAVIVAQLSNQYWFMGGFFSSLWLGTKETVGTGWKRVVFAYSLAFGVILIMGLYHLAMYAQRRVDKSSLYFALFCLVQAPFFMSYTGAIPDLFLSGTTVNEFLYHIHWIFFASYISPILFAHFLRSLFPEEFSAWFVKLAWGAFGLLIVALMILGFPRASYLNIIYFPVVVLALILGLSFLIKSVVNKREGALLSLCGFGFFVGTVSFDSFQTIGLIPYEGAWTPIGLVVFILAQSMLIARRFALAHQKAEHYSLNLEQEVRIRTDKLNQSTCVAVEAKHELEIANEKLLDLDKQKTRFFQNVSHELRTPLTLMMGPLQELQEQQNDNATLSMAVRNSRRLLKLVNQLLDFQKVGASKRELKLEPIPVQPFLFAFKDFFEEACKSAQVKFEIDLQYLPAGTLLEAEVDALEKVIFNFLSNALKFTPADGEVVLRAAVEENILRIEVSDTGTGIASDDLATVFDVFTQAHTDSQNSRHGSGLGLALAKELTEMLGGTIGVQSAQGAGSTFWIEFSVGDEVSMNENDDNLVNRVKDLIGNSGREVSGKVPKKNLPEPNSDLAPKILVVDDISDMRFFIQRFFKKQGYRVAEAESGEAALRQLESDSFDLVVTDWMMPAMSGPELIEAIRGNEEWAGLPIVLLTAKSDEESRISGTVTGADGFVGKPFTERELSSVVRNLLSLKENEKKLSIALEDLKRSTALERRHMKNLLAQGEKLSSLGRLIATIGHEIANPISLISLASDEQGDQLDRFEETLMEALEQVVDKPKVTGLLEQIDEIREYVGHNQTATTQLKGISHALRTQSRSESSPTEGVALTDVLEEALLLCSGKLKRWTVTKDIVETDGVTCYRSQIGQIFTNLVSNAADAVGEKAKNLRDAGQSHRGEVSISIQDSVVDGIDGVAIAISDNGDGVSEADQSKLFDEFFTTKEAGSGTGLGLSVSMKLAREHGGTLAYSSSATLRGACFTLWLPRHSDVESKN